MTDIDDVQLGTDALEAAVQHSADPASSIHHHGDGVDPCTVEGPISQTHPHRHAWLEALVPGAEKLTVKFHAGNYVAIRDPSKPPGSVRIFESMPLYARIGMHLLFCGREQVKLLEGGKLESRLREQSEKEGRIYDSPESVSAISSFVSTYKINLDELLEPDLTKYPCFNAFFSRKLKPSARPLQNPSNALNICCAADCRLVVYPSVSAAQTFWIKGDEFTLEGLLHGPSTSHTHRAHPATESPPYAFDVSSPGSSLALFRLAPADYHRFHSPVAGSIVHGPIDIPGTYYTVNPQAVNEPKLDVFTANRRSIIYIRERETGKVVALVAIGALLVGSVGWSKREVGEEVERGEEMGWFAYGGSTVVVVFPEGMVCFDEDLRVNSEKTLETLVRVGDSLGQLV